MIRNLYVAIAFYGKAMKPKDTVWHGLSQKMVFKEFSTYFDCPTSTTTQVQVAANFAEDGGGIVLKLKSRHADNPCIALDVSHFSAYQEGL